MLVLLSASVEKFFVFHIQDFLKLIHSKQMYEFLNYGQIQETRRYFCKKKRLVPTTSTKITKFFFIYWFEKIYFRVHI